MTYLDITTPINIAEEKTKFFSSQTYSPQFKYTWEPPTIAKYQRAMPKLIPLTQALLAQDGHAIMLAASDIFKVVYRAADVDLARQLTQQVPLQSNGTVEDYAALARQRLAELGIDYRVEVVDQQGFQARPDHPTRILRISKYLHLQFYTVEGVVSHELVHIIRAVNGQANGIAVQPDYLPTDEGLASLVQDKFYKSPTGSAFQHGLEYLASYLSQDHGFREVYEFLCDHGCDAENAWLRTIRQKFGLCDTAQPGGLLKSGMSFYHAQLLRELSRSEITRLFVGKISFHQLSDYPTYSGQLALDKLETFLG